MGVVVCRISIQIAILSVREKQGKVVTGVKTLIDILDTAARCLARSRIVGLSLSWTRGPDRDVVLYTKNTDTAIQDRFAGKAIPILNIWLC